MRLVMKKLFFPLIFILCFFFLSCSGDIKISIYTRDLSDIMSSKENVLYTNVNVIVENLKDEADIEFLRNNLNGFSNEHFVKHNYSDSLSFDIKIPILKNGTELDTSKDLLIITGKNNKDKNEFYLQYNKELLSRLNSYIYSAHYQNIDLSKFKLLVEINNDERNPVSLTTYSCYINGKSYPFTHKENLKERDRISFEVSEIFANYMAAMDNTNYPLFAIK